jgi:hypothetical protein
MGRDGGSLPRGQVVLFQFLSCAEKRRRVAAANMNGHFIDGFAGSSDIGPSRDCSAEGYPHENGSNTGKRRCAQAHGAALLLCGDRRLSLNRPSVNQFAFPDRSAGEAGE